MKELNELVFPENLLYFLEHTWVRGPLDDARVGITDYAQDQLGEVIFVDLPEIGTSFRQNDIFGFVESIKTASDLFMPVDGTVFEVNAELGSAPEKINSDPYEKGWIIHIRCDNTSQLQALMSATDYRGTLGG